MATQPNDGNETGEQTRQRALVLWRQEADLPEVLVRRICRTLGTSVQVDELIAAGREGLLEAAMRFDPGRGVPFRAYANIRVHGAIIDALRQTAPYSRGDYRRLKAMEAAHGTAAGTAEFFYKRQPSVSDPDEDEGYLGEHLAQVATAVAVAIAAPTETDPSESCSESTFAGGPEEAVSRAELLRMVQSALEQLAADESEIVRLRYFEGKSWTEAADSLNTTRSWAIRLHARAVARLAKYMRSHE